jgi:hypothetical protein
LLAPVASAHTPVVYSAPYAHATALSITQASTGGCSRLTTAHPTFNTTTGVGGYEARATATTCSDPLAGLLDFSYAGYLGGVQVVVPLKAFSGKATSTSLLVTWKVWAGDDAGIVENGKCAKAVVNATTGDGVQNCDLAGYGNLTATAYLADLTNGTRFSSSSSFYTSTSNFTYKDTLCHAFKCHTQLHRFGSAGLLPGVVWIYLPISGALNHADRYVVVTTIYASGNASVYCYPNSCFQGSSAFSHVEIAQVPGYAWNWTLRSITMS